MVRPLTKRRKDGAVYTRRAAVEQAITQAVREAPDVLRARAAIARRDDPQYLPSEVLIYLIRNALHAQDSATSTVLINCLGRRCAIILKHKVGATNVFSAEDVRSDTLCKLYDLLADELQDPSNTTLDYYEINFNHAFAKLRVDVIRAAIRLNVHFASTTPSPAADEDDEKDEIPEAADLSPEADLVVQTESHDLLRRIQALPVEERLAVLWKIEGYKTESIDPTEKTVATLCRVSGSEIRSRLRSAKARLKQMEEES